MDVDRIYQICLERELSDHRRDGCMESMFSKLFGLGDVSVGFSVALLTADRRLEFQRQWCKECCSRQS